MTFLIWKSLLHRKLQNLAIVFSIAVGAAIVFCVGAIYNGVASGMELSQQRMGADIVIIPGGATIEPSLILFGGAAANSYMPQSTVESVRAISGVSQATPQFFTHTLTADCHDIGTNNRMIGYDPASDWIVGPWLKKVHKGDLGSDEVILGAKVPTWVENKIAILGKWYTVVSVAEETGTSLDYSLFVSMDEARRVVADSSALKTIWDKQGPPAQLISAILVKIDKNADVNDIVREFQAVGYVQPIVAADVKKRIVNDFTAMLILLGGVGLMAVVTALFNMFARLYALTLDRQAEWGLYRAIGASVGDIGRLIVGEAIAVALAGSLVGIILGGALYMVSLLILEYYRSFPFVEPSWQFFIIISLLLIALFTGLGALAAWLPAYRGSRIDPSTIMTRGEFD